MTTATTNPTLVWDRLWRTDPDTRKDDRLLARERRNPRWRLVVEKLRNCFGDLRGLRTIELGSGRGDLSVLLAQAGANVTLFDASRLALDQARRRFDRLGLRAGFVLGDFLNLDPTLCRRFDVSLSSGVIEHFRGMERTEAAAAHRHCLRDGGVGIISVPHAHCVSYRLWKTWLEWRRRWPYGLEIPYSRKELADRVARAGFKEVELHALGWWQSVGDHWGRNVLRRTVDWVDRPSALDRAMGMTLLSFGRRL